MQVTLLGPAAPVGYKEGSEASGKKRQQIAGCQSVRTPSGRSDFAFGKYWRLPAREAPLDARAARYGFIMRPFRMLPHLPFFGRAGVAVANRR